MKKIIFFTALLALAAADISAQPFIALKKVLELKMQKTADDDMPGTRGASVAWNPLAKKYYAVFAGNMGFPLAVFDEKGKRLTNDDLTAMIDTRGLWYNPSTKQICGNGYSDNGWFAYKSDSKGLVKDIEVIAAGQYQPDAQCTGAYNPVTKQVLFLYGSQVTMYDSNQMPVDSLTIHWSRKKADGPADTEDRLTSSEDHNYTNVLYTGLKGRELAFLNITDKVIELYDIKSGYMTGKLNLPETAKTEASFNFAYANGIYWLFDIENRTWKGYK